MEQAKPAKPDEAAKIRQIDRNRRSAETSDEELGKVSGGEITITDKSSTT